MKNRIFKHKYILGFLLFSAVAFASGIPQKFGTDILQLGNPNSTDSKQVIFDTGDGATNPSITVDMTNKEFNFNKALNFVTTKITLGEGSNADQEFIFDVGLGTANPRFAWIASESALSFANDGVNFKKIGSGAGGGAGFNVLQDFNSDFESGTPPIEWNPSGTGVFSAETTSPIFGDQSGLWDPTGSGDTLSSATVTIPDGVVGRTCAIAFDYKFPGTEGDILVEVDKLEGATLTTATSTALPSTVLSKPFIQFFTCPNEEDGQLTIRFRATADAALLTIDNVFIGTGRAPFVASEILQQSMFGNSGSTSNTGGEDITNFIIQRNTGDQTLFEWNGTRIVALKDHYATVMFTHNSQNSSSGVRIFEGPIGSQILFSQANCSNNTFDCTTSWSGLVEAGKVIRFNTSSSSSSAAFSYTGTRVEQAVDETLTVETSGDYNEAVISLGTPGPIGLGLGASSFGQIGSSDLELTNIKGNGFITCASNLVEPDGTTCSGGSAETVGYAFTPSSSGNYEICFNFNTKVIGAAADGIFQRFYIERQTNDRTLIERGVVSRGSGGYDSASGSSDYYNNINLCNTFQLQAGAQANFAVSIKRVVINSDVVVNSILAEDPLNPQGEYNVHITAKNLDTNVPSPVFTDVQNSVREKIRGSRDGVKFVSCKLDNGGTSPPTFSPTSNTCADWIDNITRSTAGNYQINFVAGTFTQAPDCLANVTASNSAIFDTSAQGNNVNSIQILTKQSGVGLVDAGFTIMCSGE